MIKKLLIIFIILVLSQIIFAEEDNSIQYTLDAQLDVEISSNIEIYESSKDSYLGDLKVILNYLPQNSFRQEIISLSTSPKAKFSDKIIFEWENIDSENLIFLMNMKINTKNSFYPVNKKVLFPIKKYPINIYDYTKPSAMMDINDDIKKIAAELAQNDDDLYSVVFKLSSWTKKNIKYDLSSSAANAVKSSSWVLRNKKGVCDELTNLFISLCRSLGIPARFVSGISHTNSLEFSQPWGMHGWAEVYFPDNGWVPFDPTYGQIGYVDAGHIKLRDSIDSNISSTEYEWKGRNIDIIPNPLDINVKILHLGNKLSPLLDISATVFEDNVGYGSYNFIKATIKNNNIYYAASTIRLSIPKEIEILDNFEKYIILKPYEKKSIFWKIFIPDNFENNMIYTFPVLIYTDRNYSIDTSFTTENSGKKISLDTIEQIILETNDESSHKLSDSLTFYCNSNKNEVDINEKVSIDCTITNEALQNFENINVCLEKDCKKISIDKKGVLIVNFEKIYEQIGAKFLLISAKNKDISKSAYINMLVLDSPRINISNTEFPKEVDFSDTFNINFTLTKVSYQSPKDTKVKFYTNNNFEEYELNNFEAITPFTIQTSSKMLKYDKNTFKIVLEYNDKNGKQYSNSEEFYIRLNETTFFEKLQIILYQTYFWIERNIENLLK